MTSLAGYAADLRTMPVGATISRAARVPVAETASLDAFRRSITSANAKADGEFVMQTLRGVSEDYRYAVLAAVVTRVA